METRKENIRTKRNKLSWVKERNRNQYQTKYIRKIVERIHQIYQ